tara:strand:- start:30 stop:794 length:765 start_codon:yes stop_codon:yes gene_type:complete
MNNLTELTVSGSECRICFEPQTLDNILIYPCACNGTSKYIHMTCLQKWRNTTTNLIGTKRCMECHVFYEIVKEYPIEKSICSISISPFIFIFGGILIVVSYVICLLEFMFYNYNFSTLIITFSNQQNEDYISLLIKYPLTSITYYCSVVQFIVNVFIPILYFYNIYFKIFRKQYYFKKTIPYLSFNIISMFYPQIIYYNTINNYQSFFDMTSLANVLIIFWWLFFYNQQFKIIKYMNNKLNNEIIKNYDDNDII